MASIWRWERLRCYVAPHPLIPQDDRRGQGPICLFPASAVSYWGVRMCFESNIWKVSHARGAVCSRVCEWFPSHLLSQSRLLRDPSVWECAVLRHLPHILVVWFQMLTCSLELKENNLLHFLIYHPVVRSAESEGFFHLPSETTSFLDIECEWREVF